MSRRASRTISSTRWASRPARQLSGARPGFTLTELLVVLAITAVLMTILFIPISRALDLTARAQASVAGQGAVRNAVARIVRDLSSAMEVYEPRDIQIWGYGGTWGGTALHPVPPANPTPKAYTLKNGMIAFRLPKQQYYDTQNNHYVTQDDINTAMGAGAAYDQVALATCPRHQGAPVELRPVNPPQPEERITAYFIGLKNPGLLFNGGPAYDNILLFKNPVINGNNTLNTYALFRVEFSPSDPNFSNWQKPNFYYDTTQAPNGLPFWQNWASITRTVMDNETADVIQWVQDAATGEYMPHALVTFAPNPVSDEVAQPNRENNFNLLGGVGPAFLPPVEYQTEFGNWLGMPVDFWASGFAATQPFPTGTPIPDSLQLSNVASGAIQVGPHIQIVSRSNGLQFDSELTTPRNREVSYDGLTGRVITSFPRWDYKAANLPADSFSATVDSTTNSITLYNGGSSSANDVAVDPNGMPASFGAAAQKYGSGNVSIVPGSEVVQVYDTGVAGFKQYRQLRRVGYELPISQANQGSTTGNAENPPQRGDEYMINYATGVIQLYSEPPAGGSSDPQLGWSQYGPNTPLQVLVKYRFQTNSPDDVVRVGYQTKEVLGVNVGIVEYTRRRQESLPFEVSQRVVVRNLKR